MKRNLLHILVFVLLLTCTTIGGGIRTASTETLPAIYVNPKTSSCKMGSEFTVDINIANVTMENSGNGVYGWEFDMSFNSSLIEAVDIKEGPWLKSTGEDTLFTCAIDNKAGTAVGTNFLYTYPDTGVIGSGKLANVTFHAKALGTCSLDLYKTLLRTFISPNISEVNHTAADGSVTTTPAHDVSVLSSITAPPKGFITFPVAINVTVKNEGSYRENVNITLKCGTTFIGNKTLNINSTLSSVARFNWTITGVTPGNYTLRATATVLKSAWNPGGIDEDLHDNTVDGGIRIKAWVPGDGDFNELVEMADFYIWRQYFGTYPPWPPNVYPDYNRSGYVEMYDFYTWRDHFGQSDP